MLGGGEGVRGGRVGREGRAAVDEGAEPGSLLRLCVTMVCDSFSEPQARVPQLARYSGHPDSDAALFSFGPIKFATAFQVLARSLAALPFP